MTTRLVYYPFAYYYRPFASSIWIDISSAIKTQAKWELSFTGNNLLSFNFQMNEITDSDGVLIVPRTGDDFCICENSKAIRIVDNQLCGKAWPAKPNPDGSWHTAQSRPRLFWDINVMQRDFSTIATVTLEYKVPTLLSEILTALLLLTTGDKLGGVMADGTVINKWKLIAPDIYVESFDYSGFPMGGLINLLSSIGYKFLIKYYVEPDTTNTIKVFAQVEIIEGIGTIPRSPLWINGISNDVFRRATVLNPDYDGTYNPDEPQYLPVITEFDIDPDPSTIRNSLGILAYVQDGDSLTEYIEVQGDKPKDTFDLGYRYRDIIFASRFIQCKVSNDSTPSSTQFSVPYAESLKMIRDQSRLVSGDYLVCKITHSSVSYYYNFTISGQLITLISLAYGSTAIPSAMTVGEDFKLVKSVSIMEDNRQFGEGYPNYGAVKNTTLTSNGTLRFLKYDIPRPADKVYIAGYKLEEYKTNINDINSINNFDPLPDTLEIDFPVTKEQIGIIETVLAEQAKELTTVNFTSTLPDPPYPGDKFPIEITNLYDDIVVTNTVKSSFISITGEKGKTKIKREVSCAPRRSGYIDVINKFRQSYKLKNPTTPENIKDKVGSEISLIWEISDFARPENLIASGITETEFTVSWDTVTDAVRYGIEIATNVNFTNSSILTGYHGYAQTSNTIIVNSPFLVIDTLYYFRVFAINSNGKESAWSDTLEVTPTDPTPTINKLLFSSNSSGAYQIWISDENGSNAVNLTNDGSKVDTYPCFNKQKTKISWTRAGGEIWIATLVNGTTATPSITGATKLTGSDNGKYSRFNNAGTKLTFTSNRDGANEIYTMNIDGSSPTRITTSGANKVSCYSFNDSTLIFQKTGGGDEKAYTKASNGSGSESLLTASCLEPMYSPDGTRFVYRTNGSTSRVTAVDANGSTNSVTITTEDFDHSIRPVYSPDGTKVMFSHGNATWDLRTRLADHTGSETTVFSGGGFNYFCGDWG